MHARASLVSLLAEAAQAPGEIPRQPHADLLLLLAGCFALSTTPVAVAAHRVCLRNTTCDCQQADVKPSTDKPVLSKVHSVEAVKHDGFDVTEGACQDGFPEGPGLDHHLEDFHFAEVHHLLELLAAEQPVLRLFFAVSSAGG